MMKKNYYLIFKLLGMFAVFAFVCSACMSSRKYQVESDYSYQGKFKKYKTFAFLKDTNADTSLQNSIIEEEIKFRMELLGYKLDEKKPHLLVSYKIFYDNLRFTGYSQPEIEAFVKNEEYLDEKDQNYDPIKYNLREGTLLIVFFDGKQERAIWQGYASGIFGNAFFNSSKYLKKPVRLIFDKYKFLADGFIYNDKESR
ncbi:MAG: DUF4136 domain-containing protein [Thermoflexibacter sp.]|jgi:hypothetical protein|nr:DUF4136 domain-containing protein [Thermoflexibacter sp.]